MLREESSTQAQWSPTKILIKMRTSSIDSAILTFTLFTPVKIGFPKLFQAFRIKAENLLVAFALQNLDFYRLSDQRPLSNNWVSGSVFGCLRNPVISHPNYVK